MGEGTTRHGIPGTVIFDGAEAQKGYALNRMCFSFNEEANREAFLADEKGDGQGLAEGEGPRGIIATSADFLRAAAGIYAVVSFTVTQRRREIGIRAALGANARRILASVLARAAGQVGGGGNGGRQGAGASLWGIYGSAPGGASDPNQVRTRLVQPVQGGA